MSDMDTLNNFQYGRSLVYAFIPYYRCLYDVNLNFDQRFIIDYRPGTRLLSVKINDLCQEDFWPDNISSVSVIAGKNGAGKSSVLRWLLEKTLPYTQNDTSEPLFNGIIAISEGKKLIIYHGIPGLKQEKNKLSNRELDIQLMNVSGWSPQRLLDKLSLKPIYYSGHFDSNIDAPDFDDDEDPIWNISDIYALQRDSDLFASRYLSTNKIREVEYLRYYHLCNDLRICKLLLDRRFQNTFSIGGQPALRLPRYIVIIRDASVKPLLQRRIQNVSNSITAQSGITKNSTKKDKKILDLLKKISNVPLNQTMQTIAEFEEKQGLDEYLYYALQNFCFQVIEDDTNEYALKYTLVNLFAVDYKDVEDSVVGWTKKARNIFRVRVSKHNTKLSQESLIFVDDFFDALEEAICFLDRLKWKDSKAFIDCVSTIKDPDFIPPKGAQIYAEFFPPAYKRLHDVISSVERFSFITYSHTLERPSTLSSGELAMLNLYSRIKYAFDELSLDEHKVNSVVLLLDEAEIGFHPEWQRQFVNKLTQFISMINVNRNPIQIIYTTHSPITLSDMPKECVNLLRSDHNGTTNETPENKKETFGANVFELYGDSFFMEHGLIGEFASEKILQLASEIDTLVKETAERSDYEYNMNRGGMLLDGDRIQNLRSRIDMIGDERIKHYLHSRLNKVDPNEEIRYLKERLAFLEARHNNPHEKD